MTRQGPGTRPLGPPRRPLGILRGAALSATISACADDSGKAVPPAENLLLVTIDTTRADRLGCYGHAAAGTPALDRLAAEGIRFDRALTVTPITLPSHATILTGLSPTEHGVRDNGVFKLDESVETLAEVLKREGFATAAFVSSAVLAARHGLPQGFDVYDDQMDGLGADGPGPLPYVERSAKHTVDAVLRWIEEGRPEPWFLWVHFYDPHFPHTPPEPYRSRHDDAYDAELAAVDAELTRMLQGFDAGGRLERTLLVVTSDHGESLMDHQERSHGLFLYDATIRVPLLIRYPPLGRGKVVEGQCSLVSLYPTMLELLGRPVAAREDSLVPVLARRQPSVEQDAYMETYLPYYSKGLSGLEAVADPRYKYILAPRPELYDVRADPAEEVNLYGERPEEVERLQELLRELRGAEQPIVASPTLSLTPDEEQALLGLGYLGHSAAQDSSGGDPKDYVEVFNAEAYAGFLNEQKRYAEAEKVLEEIQDRCPSNASGWSLLGHVRLRQEKYEEALDALLKSLAISKDQALAASEAALCKRKLGDVPGAVPLYEHAIESAERFFDPYLGLSECWLALGELAKADEVLRQALERCPLNDKQRAVVNERLTFLEQARSDRESGR